MNYFKISFFAVIMSLNYNPASSQTEEITPVVRANDWDNLFIRREGWFGGDGIFAIPLDGKEYVPATENTETLIIFSDTMVGKLSGDTLRSGDFSMVNNSFALLNGAEPNAENIRFTWGMDQNKPKAIFTPKNGDSKEYFWLGDGFVNIDGDSTLYIFAYKIVNTHEGSFPFKQVGISLIAVPPDSKPPYQNHQQIETPFSNDELGSFGSAIFVNTKSAGAPNPDGFIYIYGVRGVEKELLVARVPPENFTHFQEWRYWDGSKWTEKLRSAAAITKNVSNEMSISPLLNDKLLLTYQVKGIYPEVAIQVGASPVGPFEPSQTIWHTDETKQDKDFFTYNAKAHPHLSPKGSILISYNVNSFDFWNDILKTPNLYRPRFILLSRE